MTGAEAVLLVLTAIEQGEGIAVLKEDFGSVSQGSKNEQNAGFVVDEVVKRLFRPYQLHVSPRYAKYDVALEDLFIEVKSSTKWFGPQRKVWITSGELAHAEEQLKKGIDTLYLFFDATEGERYYENIETIDFVGGSYYSKIKHLVVMSPYGGYEFNQKYLSSSVHKES
jgi:hypothetical protein